MVGKCRSMGMGKKGGMKELGGAVPDKKVWTCETSPIPPKKTNLHRAPSGSDSRGGGKKS